MNSDVSEAELLSLCNGLPNLPLLLEHSLSKVLEVRVKTDHCETTAPSRKHLSSWNWVKNLGPPRGKEKAQTSFLKGHCSLQFILTNGFVRRFLAYIRNDQMHEKDQSNKNQTMNKTGSTGTSDFRVTEYRLYSNYIVIQYEFNYTIIL